MKTLFYGGTIVTMAEPMYAEAVLVENGVIRAVGTLDGLKAMAGDCRMVDLKGAAMLPGFVDPHSHFFQVAASFLQASVDGCSSAEAMKDQIRDFLRQRKIAPGTWIHVRDYDNNIMPGLRHPSLSQLDEMAPENPMIMHHKSGHMGLLNSLAIEKLGLTPESPCPDGGRICGA